VHALRIPQIIITDNRLRIFGIDALCVFLRRYAYPNRFFDMMKILGRSCDELSRITTYIMDHLFTNFHHLLDTFDKERLTPTELEIYAEAVHKKGALLPDTWGFIDGTTCNITRPSRNQKQVFNGHK
jgi:hypothetical protein